MLNNELTSSRPQCAVYARRCLTVAVSHAEVDADVVESDVAVGTVTDSRDELQLQSYIDNGHHSDWLVETRGRLHNSPLSQLIAELAKSLPAR